MLLLLLDIQLTEDDETYEAFRKPKLDTACFKCIMAGDGKDICQDNDFPILMTVVYIV